MGLLDKFFAKYDDAKLVRQVELALVEDPRLKNVGDINVVSENGVIQLIGHVPQGATKDRAETIAVQSVSAIGLKYDHVENRLEIVK